MARVFPFILKQNIKPYMPYGLGLGLELENFVEKKSARVSIDQV